MAEPERPWEELIRRLYQGFKRFDEERAVLRQIDQSLLASARGWAALERTMHNAVTGLSRIYALSEPGLCYVYTGTRLILLGHTAATERPAILPTCAVFDDLASRPDRTAAPISLPRNNSTEALYAQLGNARKVVACPLYTPAGQLLCLLLFPDSDITEGSDLSRPEFIQTLHEVAGQLSIAYEHFWRLEYSSNMQNLWDMFLSSDLAPSKCFAQLAESVPLFLPQLGPLRFESKPEIQILVVNYSQEDDTPQFMTIRATTGTEPNTTRIDIGNSICGLLVENSTNELRYFCDDPTKPQYGARYKDYLGASKNKVIRTEMVARIIDRNNRLIGLLNLESDKEEAFPIHHCEAVLDLAPRLAPMVQAFEDRLRQNSLMQRSVAATAATYLDSLASVFRHGMGTPTTNLRTDVDFLKTILSADLATPLAIVEKAAARHGDASLRNATGEINRIISKAEKALARLLSVGAQISGFASEFAQNISGFGNFGRMDLVGLVEETVLLVKQSLLLTTDVDIAITVEGAARADVFCSPLIKQHLYCIFHNAILSVQERIRRRPGPGGLITVSVAKVLPSRERQEVELNEKWELSVWDNGLGVSKPQLDQLREFRPGVRFRKTKGLGYALPATQRYFASIDGAILLYSDEDKYFEVKMYFDAYRKDLHEALDVPLS